jgi:hypothetical protein
MPAIRGFYCKSRASFRGADSEMTIAKPDPARDAPVVDSASRRGLYLVIGLFLVLSAVFGSANLDIDEFGFVREPYELLGGDYTIGYIQRHEYARAMQTLVKSYAFFWNYRPLFSPIISEADQQRFAAEERDFGYVKPARVSREDPDPRAKYARRLIVPEPDRFYSHGAGKPLLSAIVSVPQLLLVKSATSDSRNLLYYQYAFNYHPIFILARLVQLLAGVATIVIVYRILLTQCDRRTALLGAAIVALFPTSVKYFPNLHHDSILAPFLLASVYLFYKQRYVAAGVCFGLALATKNTTILLVPVFLGYVLVAYWRSRRVDAGAADASTARARARGFVLTMVLGLLCLLPFANPISYAREIVTPITHRTHDTRGENVEQFMVTERLVRGPGNRLSVAKPLQLLVRLEDNDFFFLVIAVVLFWPRQQPALARMCFAVLLLALPYGLEFGNYLNYRSLLFVPFFGVLCALIAPRRYLMGLVVILLCADVLLAMDPIASDSIHVPVNGDTPWTELGKALATR